MYCQDNPSPRPSRVSCGAPRKPLEGAFHGVFSDRKGLARTEHTGAYLRGESRPRASQNIHYSEPSMVAIRSSYF